MYKEHPKGLYILALANTGERFGYYTVVSVLLYYIQTKFGFSSALSGQIIGIFMAFVYLMPLFGGMVADRWSFSKCVTLGLLGMGAGYLVLALPSGMRTDRALVMMVAGMALVGLGTGLFKSNLQVMIGDLYNDPRYSHLRDSAFSIFYMAINIGAMFAPFVASSMCDLALSAQGFTYNGQLADLCNQYLSGDTSAAGSIMQTAAALGMPAQGAAAFSRAYVEALSTGYGYSFGVAFVSVALSYGIYWAGRRTYAGAQAAATGTSAATSAQPQLTREQTRSRLVALFLIFAVVIFFWMVFMQNSVTLAEFAKSCTTPTPGGWTRIGFNIFALLAIIVAVYSGIAVVQRRGRGVPLQWLLLAASAGCIVYFYVTTPDPLAGVQPQDYQQFNGFFIVALTPFFLALFKALHAKGREPSAPRKIGYGMLIAAAAYVIMLAGSLGLSGTQGDVSSNWLISTYLMLTVAELLLSPMGISFVSKVAPPKYKGAMMGCWFVSTAIGNYLISVPMMLWGKISVWTIWLILIGLCLLSAAFIFAIMRKLEAATADVPAPQTT